LFLGVDLGGAGNTWVTGLVATGAGACVALEPQQMTLEQVAAVCRERQVLAVAMDAHLSMGLADESGFRDGDRELRQELPKQARAWVGSFNSMMAIPIRGHLLGQALAPLVGTLLETHPRASLWFALEQEHREALFGYKRRSGQSRADYLACGPPRVEALWRAWGARFQLEGQVREPTEGGLDALACATVGWLYHRRPEALWRLGGRRPGATGHGPFYVVAPGGRGR
jgi:predicted nuclease with RNAse H fold